MANQATSAELVTLICKECKKQELTLQDLDKVIDAVIEFYRQTATP